MTDTDALDAGLLAVVDEMFKNTVGWNWRSRAALVQLSNDVLAALRSERVRGEESMRDRAAKVADEYKAKMAAAQERLGALGRTTSIAECKEDAADWLAAAIRALPTTDQETDHD